MDLRQLRYFLAAAADLNFRRAAERVHVSQPALSQRIQALEEELGVQLFARSAQGVRLTASGEVFAKGARQVLREVDLAVASARLADRGESGRLSVAFNEIGGQQPIVGNCLALFRTAFPNVAVELSEMGEADQYEALRAGAIDAGFHFRIPGAHGEFAARRLDAQDFVLVAPQSHPLATRERVALSDLADAPMIMLRRDVNADTYDGILRAFAQAQIPLRTVLETSSDAALLTLVAAGLGLAIAMDAPRRGGWNGLALRRIEGLSLAKEFVLAWDPNNRSPTLSKFIALVDQTRDAANLGGKAQ